MFFSWMTPVLSEPSSSDTPPDCDEPQGRGVSTRGNLPCEEEPGWEPEPIEDPPTAPCDPFMTALGGHTNFADSFKSLANINNQTLQFEKGLFVTDIASSQYISIAGQPGSPSISLVGVTIQLSGFLHTHSNALNQAPMFSPDDVLMMAEAYLNGNAKDSTNFFIGLAHGYGPPYLMKVTNTSKFRKFAEKIMKMEQNTDVKKKFSKKYEEDFNSNSINHNEKGFLDMLSRLGAGNGLSLYRAVDND